MAIVGLQVHGLVQTPEIYCAEQGIYQNEQGICVLQGIARWVSRSFLYRADFGDGLILRCTLRHAVRMSGHGFRAVARTILDEVLPTSPCGARSDRARLQPDSASSRASAHDAAMGGLS
jgi:hypothetical protein